MIFNWKNWALEELSKNFFDKEEYQEVCAILEDFEKLGAVIISANQEGFEMKVPEEDNKIIFEELNDIKKNNFGDYFFDKETNVVKVF